MSTDFTRGQAKGRLGSRKVLVWAAVGIAVIAAAAVGLAVLAEPKGQAPCSEELCGTPPSGPPLSIDESYKNSQLGYSFEYPGDLWSVEEASPTIAGLKLKPAGDAELLIVEGAPASKATPQQLIDARVDSLSTRLLGLADDTKPSHQVLDPELADHKGVVKVVTGTVDSSQGVSVPIGVVVMAAGDADVSVAATAILPTTKEKVRFAILGVADDLLNTLRLAADQRGA